MTLKEIHEIKADPSKLDEKKDDVLNWVKSYLLTPREKRGTFESLEIVNEINEILRLQEKLKK